MLRAAFGAVVGLLAGVLCVAGLLPLAWWAVNALLAPPALRMEHGVIYLSLVLGAGLGAVCGALAGVAGVVRRALRDRQLPPST
jgi:hypothetical protein